jgi:hypothetical protein
VQTYVDMIQRHPKDIRKDGDRSGKRIGIKESSFRFVESIWPVPFEAKMGAVRVF